MNNWNFKPVTKRQVMSGVKIMERQQNDWLPDTSVHILPRSWWSVMRNAFIATTRNLVVPIVLPFLMTHVYGALF